MPSSNEQRMETINQIILAQAAAQPQTAALLSPGLPSLDYGSLGCNVMKIALGLEELGIQRRERVAIVLPGGAESALAFLSVSCAAVSSPLNPNYQLAEFDFYLSDLEARALLTLEGYQTPARISAAALGIPVIELASVPDGASLWFDIMESQNNPEVQPSDPSPEDPALVLHTSGTTSRPKQVVLTHANLVASAKHISSWLSLTNRDRCLNIMPLFHIHGLMAALLASITAGGSVVCTPGFNAPRFFEWMESFQPTWYSAVPTMHQAILGRCGEHQKVVERNPLRFIRSSSSSLPPQLMQELEAAFKAPVIESYGMTEASHQMASNPLPPRPRKPGSVGLPAGPQVAIMQEDGAELCQPGELGEIVIRGPNVTRGYHANPEANSKAFSDGWFRTGDQGYFDQDGYLFITGRLKELINRGGEKISPREVEEVLLDHPAVSQAVVFAVQDTQLGEDVAAAVVLRDDTASEISLRQFLANRLSIFKVPKRILILDEIPKGATGKVQRIGLAQRLGLSAVPLKVEDKTSSEAFDLQPRDALEAKLQNLWCEILMLPQVGVNQRFTDAGGDSMLAALLYARVQEELAVELTLLDFFDAQTIEEQAALVKKKQA